MSKQPQKPFWADLPSGIHTRRVGSHPGFTAHVLRGAPGPVAVLNGGTHGDEYEGPTVLRELIDRLSPRKLTGTLVVIPVLHEDAFFAGLRCNPADGGNLARVFPGDPRGNTTQRLADLFLRSVLRHANYYIDFHSGGVEFDLLPWCGYMVTRRAELDEVQADMAACFDDMWCWASQYNPGRTISSAADVGVPALYTESLGGGGMTELDRRMLARGIDNFLIRFGFLKGRLSRLKRPPVRTATSYDEANIQIQHPATRAGLLIRAVSPGDIVRKGGLLGTIHPLDRRESIKVKAERAGTVVSVIRKRSVEAGDAVATVIPLET